MISIVLPCFNEMRHQYLPKILNNLVGQVGDKEIIAVVSESQDGTFEAIAQYPEIKIIPVEALNRPQRLNRGIAASNGEIVLLHHPASLLPEKYALEMIAKTLSQPNIVWGGFHQSFDLDHWLLRFTSWYSNEQRAKRKGIIYLDHCIFVKREALVAIQGVPELDIFEDTVLSQNLLRLGFPQLADGIIMTSARRFQERGIFKHAFLNQVLKLLYILGVDPKYLNKIYEYKVQINIRYK
ncbi:MAG: glycosyltransferase [Cyanothece sp. SIO1E1]|nr:glycosyltransferase [Cyanothece sp. SIO1E1]